MNEQRDENTADEGMSFLEHLEVLRWHLIRSASVIMLIGIFAFIGKELIFDTVILAPKNASFVTFKYLCSLSGKLHGWLPKLIDKDAICLGQNIPHLQNINMAGQFTAHIMVSIIAGLVIAFPYIMWEIWRFIKPALKSTEKKNTRGFIFYTSFLFLSGILFGYFLIVPLSVNFLATYQVSEHVLNVPTLSTYISTVTTILLACGVIFELPVFIYFLTKAGLITPAIMKKFRRHAIISALILSAIITPPDVFSQILVSIPFVVLYETSIVISGFVLKRNR